MNDPLTPLITALHNEGRLRVWSLVVTVFGDAVQQRGGRIATLRLQHLLERVGIEAGTLRTALSRLTSDGWVLRDREGRNSFYRLSDSAQAEITEAAVDFYAAPLSGEARDWVMASGDLPPDGGVKIAANTWLLATDNLPDLSKHVCVTGALGEIPHGIDKRILSQAHQNALIALHNDIEALTGVELTPLDAMAARMLLIHRWRRIVLRFPDIPQQLQAADAVLPNPRQAVADIYQQLVEKSETWLDCTEQGLTSMPARTDPSLRRFGR